MGKAKRKARKSRAAEQTSVKVASDISKPESAQKLATKSRLNGNVVATNSAGHKNDLESKSSSENELAAEKTEDSKSGKRRFRWGFPIVRKLLENDAEGLFLLCTVAPLPIGSWIAGGLKLGRPELFLMVFGILAIARWLRLIEERGDDIPAKFEFGLLLSAALVAVPFIFYNVTNDLNASLLLALFAILTVGGDLLKRDTMTSLLIAGFALAGRMSLLAIFGVYVQEQLLFPQSFILGWVPGWFLAAAIFAFHANKLQLAGWTRVGEIERKGVMVKRPGGLTRAFSLMLITGPVLPIAAGPFGFLPTAFVLSAFLLYPVPNLCEWFRDGTRSDSEIAIRAVILAGFATILLFLLGLGAAYI